MEDRTVDTSKDNKLILAILQEEDYDQTVEMLNEKHFFVTKLSSSGGFLKKKNVTIMIGVEEERLPEVSAILEKYAGRRRITMLYHGVLRRRGTGDESRRDDPGGKRSGRRYHVYAEHGCPEEVLSGCFENLPEVSFVD